MPRPKAAAGGAVVRIIGGAWKRTRLPVPTVSGLRPTPDRVRETVFNWLGQDLSGWRCLDLYAGTGALGLEAASRGATQVVLVERDARAVLSLQESCDRLGATQVRVVQAQASDWLQTCAQQFDLILLDPPYTAAQWERTAARVQPRLSPGGWVYVESAAPLQPHALPWSAWPSWRMVRAARAGQVHYHLLQAEPEKVNK